MKSGKISRLIFAVSGAILISLTSTAANSTTIFANTIIDYFDSGAGPLVGPYGGDITLAFPVSVPLTHATDENLNTFVSLPTLSSITLGFSTGFVFDGVGNDLFIAEIGAASEKANVFISSDFGLSFTFLGIADGGSITEFDLGSIAYAGIVNAVKVVGIDALGGSPGFDLSFIQGLEGSAVETPEPASLALLGLGLLGLGFNRRIK